MEWNRLLVAAFANISFSIAHALKNLVETRHLPLMFGG